MTNIQKPNVSFFPHRWQPRGIIKVVLLSTVAAIAFSVSTIASSKDLSYPLTLPLIGKNNFEYIGAFRVPDGTYGESAAGYTEGPISMGADSKSFYLVGRIAHQAIAEFSIPELVKSTNLADLNMATNIQPFAKVLDRPPTGNPQKINTIGGMEYVDGELIVNTYLYYDASIKTTHNTLVIKDAADLTGSVVEGYFSYEARAHATGWISRIPLALQDILEGTHIAGNSNISPIISRYSPGPTAFAINPRQYILGNNKATTIPTSTMLDFSLSNPLGWDNVTKVDDHLDNVGLTNDLWTRISGAVYGFIVPGTRTYVTIGYSGGHNDGIGYKATQDDGNLCGGPCSYLVADNYNHYWLWDLNDLIDVKRGGKPAYEIMPYSYGIFDAPFQPASGANKIIGGAFDSIEHILYLTIENGDREQNRYEPLPVIIAYKFPALPESPTNITIK